MTERTSFPSPPTKSGLLARDGTMALAWLAWVNALTNWAQRERVFTFAVDVPSIPAGGSAFVDFSIPGAAMNDLCSAAFDPFNADLTVVGADVRAANTVRVRIQNYGAGAVDLAAGTCVVRVERTR